MITELVIDRAKWGWGYLLRGDGRMCCLGHLGRACGISDDAMKNISMPTELADEDQTKFPESFSYFNIASDLNDSNWPIQEIEEKLINLFAENSIVLSFVGDRSEARVGLDTPAPF